MMDAYIYIDTDRCTACGVCIPACPQNAIAIHNNMAVIDQQICNQCGVCLPLCPQSAILEVQSSDSFTLQNTHAIQSSVPTQNAILSQKTQKTSLLNFVVQAIDKVALPVLRIILNRPQPSNHQDYLKKGANAAGNQKRTRARKRGSDKKF